MKLIGMLFIVNAVYSQNTSIWLTHSITKSSFDIQVNNKSNNQLSFGAGFGFNFNTPINKFSSLNYGVCISSIRDAYFIYGVHNYFSNNSIKIPLAYQLKIILDKKKSLIPQLGVNTQIQTPGKISTTIGTNNNIELNRIIKGGFFPLFYSGLGYEWITKKQKSFSLLLVVNYGFKETEKIEIRIQNPPSIVNYKNNGTFFCVEFRWLIFQSKKKYDNEIINTNETDY